MARNGNVSYVNGLGATVGYCVRSTIDTLIVRVLLFVCLFVWLIAYHVVTLTTVWVC
jgi:hypothetical protein